MSFYIEKIIVTGSGKTDSIIELSNGVNIIYGPSNTGKTYIVKCIDYMFGSEWEPIDISTGYQYIKIIVRTQCGPITMSRKIGENKIEVSSNDNNVPSGKYATKASRTNYDKTINSVWLSLIGINDLHLVISNENYKKQILSWRTFSHMFMLTETKIISEYSAILSGRDTSNTAVIASLIFLLSGQDFAETETKDTKEIKEAKKNAVKAYINKELFRLSERNQELLAQLKENPNIDIAVEIEKIMAEISTNEKRINSSIEENQKILAQLYEKNENLSECNVLLNRYDELTTQYDADLKRLNFRGLRKDATLFNEIVIDVNTMYFERNGGYEYAKQFYEEAFHFIEEKFGADNVISAVMHADEINLAATEDLGKEVYHYHLHAMVLPVVEKEILWSKRCKDPELRGTVKEVVNQISHSKKWKSDIPLVDEKGNPLLRKNGKPMFRASYSILQDELFNHMTEKGFKGFQRGEYGSTAEHLTSLQYQIKQDTQRLDKLQQRIQKEQVKYKSSHQIFKTYNEIDSMGQKTFTGKMAISKEDYKELTTLAKEGITSRAEIKKLEENVGYYQQRYYNTANALENMKSRYNELKEKCRPFLQALEHFPEVAKLFTEKVKQLFSFKEAQERAEKEAREKERQDRIKARRKKRDMER